MILNVTNEIFADDLRDPAYAAGYLNITLDENGIEGFLYALQKVARAHGISKVAASSDLPRASAPIMRGITVPPKLRRMRLRLRKRRRTWPFTPPPKRSQRNCNYSE